MGKTSNKRKRAATKQANAKDAVDAVLPLLGSFLSLDDNEKMVGVPLVEKFVRTFVQWPTEVAAQRSDQVVACIASGNVTVVKALLAALVHDDDECIPLSPLGVTATSKPANPDANPGANPDANPDANPGAIIPPSRTPANTPAASFVR